MREIKFRAIAVSSGRFVYGNFIHSKRFEGCSNEFRIHQSESGIESDVHPETVGQFTGLKDKNGVEIWEGDVVKIDDLYDTVCEVKYHEGMFVPLVQVKEGYNCIDNFFPDFFEVIGNIHETQAP